MCPTKSISFKMKSPRRKIPPLGNSEIEYAIKLEMYLRHFLITAFGLCMNVTKQLRKIIWCNNLSMRYRISREQDKWSQLHPYVWGECSYHLYVFGKSKLDMLGFPHHSSWKELPDSYNYKTEYLNIGLLPLDFRLMVAFPAAKIGFRSEKFGLLTTCPPKV